MRRSVATVLCVVPALVAGGIILAGCEDGPNQTYTPASGTLFNNGDVDGATGVVEASLEASYPSVNVLEPCTPALKRQRWAKMLTESIAPPLDVAGLCLDGAPRDGTDKSCGNPLGCCRTDQWPGLSVEKAMQPPDPVTLEGGNCQGLGAGGGACGENQNDTCGAVVWGDNGEVGFSYDFATHLIDQLTVQLGYTGLMTFKSQSGHHTYTLGFGFPITKDGKPYLINWNDYTGKAGDSGDDNQDCSQGVGCSVNELFRAMMATYAPKIGYQWTAQDDAQEQATGCVADGKCLYAPEGDGFWYFGIRPLGTYLRFIYGAPQPIASQPNNMYIDYAKFIPGSTLQPTLAVSQQGPFTSGSPIGATTTCTQALGQTYQDYLNNCVMPYGTPGSMSDTNNKINYEKLVGGHTHNVEEVTFTIVGVNQDFSLSNGALPTKGKINNGTNLGEYDVVQDTQLPQPGDQSTEWYFDVRAFGIPLNECSDVNNCPGTEDRRGTGLIMREYQRLVENDIAFQVGKLPSAPESCQFASDPNVATKLGLSTTPTPIDNAHVCTGFEGMMVGGSATFPGDPPALGQSYADLYGFEPSVMKPGGPAIVFFENAAVQPNLWFPGFFTGATSPDGYIGFDYGSFWDESLQWVVRVMGHGDINNLPQELRDRRYFFKWFGIAWVKYMKAYGDVLAKGGNPNDPSVLNPAAVAAEPIDLETLFFDNNFGLEFDKLEYIDLSTIAGFAGNTTAPDPSKPYLSIPLDVEYGTDVKTANQRYTYWYKRMDREELSLYQALSPVKSDPPGAHANFGVNITNMFGSPVLAAIPAGQTASGLTMTYECAQAPYINGQWQNTALFPNAAQHCVSLYPGGPPKWLLDPLTGNSLMDSNGQMQNEEAASGSPANVQSAYHAVVDGQAHTLLWQYPAAFGGRTIFSQGHSPMQVCPPGATNCWDKSHPNSATNVATSAAQVYVPSFNDPWHACATAMTLGDSTQCDPAANGALDTSIPLSGLVPWLPNQPGNGFNIAVNGSSALFVQTAQVDFSGNLETYSVFYRPWQDPLQPSCAYQSCEAGYKCSSGTCVANDDSIEIMAINANDFLGDVFPCMDPTSGDVLAVDQYDPTLNVLEWLTDHPGDPFNASAGQPSAQTSCGMIVSYSPFDNYPDSIWSLSNGVFLNSNHGQGFGRIVDVMLFNPNFEQITQ
ncbi:MAG TPA: hypothetical protein VF765_03120 [Polyangiaceae bacterium]